MDFDFEDFSTGPELSSGGQQSTYVTSEVPSVIPTNRYPAYTTQPVTTSSVATSKSIPINVSSSETKGKGRKKLTTDQIIAICLVCFIVAGVIFMVLGFLGIFNRSGPTVSLTPSLTPPTSLPTTVPIS
jgi:cytochrome c biogenesis factor